MKEKKPPQKKAAHAAEEVCLIGGIIWLTTLIGKPC